MPVLQTGLAKSAAADYTIDQSLRFGSTDYLSRTPASTTNRKTWTISAWVKRSTLGNDGGSTDRKGIMGTVETGGAGGNGEKMIRLQFTEDDELAIASDNDSYLHVATSAVYRDLSAWYHIVCACDTTQATDTNRLKFYVNGEQVTSFSTATWPAEDLLTAFNYTHQHRTGYGYGAGTEPLEGYLAEFYFIDGLQYAASDFGELDSTTNQWKPIDAKDDLTFGTNGFYQKYAATELADSFEDAVKYTVTSFTTVESTTWTAPAGVTSVEYLVVAGGGSGANSAGAWGGGGGGAGGLRTGTLSVTPSSSYTVTVGAGGTAVASAGNGVNGSDSVFSSITSTGGGGGGNGNGLVGGSGGGAGGTGGSNTGAAGTAGQGYAGGSNAGGGCTYGTYGGAGGGGSSAVGGSSGGGLRVGGAGTASSITGASVTYAGGGGGGITNAGSCTGGAGGSGGGGAGGTNNAGTNATGYGSGGGGNGDGGGDSGTGSSGIVIIRYVDSSGTVSGHTITAVGDVTNTRAQSKVGDSSIYFPAGSDYLSIPDSADWDVGTGDFTIEAWTNFTNSGADNNYDNIFKQHGYFQFARRQSTNQLYMYSGTNIGSSSVDTLADGTWRHVAVCRDSGTVYGYINGVSVFNYADTSDLDYSPAVTVGSDDGSATWYIDELRFSDTARYPSGTTFTSFGQDGGTIASPTPFTADSNTKLLIHSADFDGGLGADSSGNENDFSVTNLVATDVVLDSPSNTFATINPLAYCDTLSEGNLKTTGTGSWYPNSGTIGMSSGKWYWEFNIISLDSNTYSGIMEGKSAADGDGYPGGAYNTGYGYKQDGQLYTSPSTTASYGATYAAGDIMGVALDMDDGTLTFYKNNATQGEAATGLTGTYLPAFSPQTSSSTFVINFGQDSSFAGYETAQGNQDSNGIGDFYYEPPADHLALCSSNLPSPEIALPTDHFNTQLWTGTGSGQTFSNFTFQPDFLWFKQRNGTSSHALFDSVRGVNSGLDSGSNVAENTAASASQDLVSFDDDGFTTGTPSQYGSLGSSTNTIVTWSWKGDGVAGGTLNEDGDTDSYVNVNTAAGFSIVKVTFPDALDHTFGHGLSQAPELVIGKDVEATALWWVYSKPTGNTKYLELNTNVAASDAYEAWQDSTPSASLIYITGGVYGTDEEFINYCFHSVEGYSKVGSYDGNYDADGPFVYTGFKPAYVLIKVTDTADNWVIHDSARGPYNANEPELRPNTSDAEAASSDTAVDFLSNGFKLRNSDTGYNRSYNYIYYAVASIPFKYSRGN